MVSNVIDFYTRHPIETAEHVIASRIVWEAQKDDERIDAIVRGAMNTWK